MKQILLAAGLALAVCACSGLELRAMGPNEPKALFNESNKKNGYIAYEPMVVVEISDETSCLKKDGEKCVEIGAVKCKVGTPFYLPNYERPYLVNSKTGFGKAGVDVTIANGWQIGSIKDSTDNSSLLPFIQTITGTYADRDVVTCKKSGLYRLVRVDSQPAGQQMKLVPIIGYAE